ITAKILPQFYHQCDLEDLVLMVSTVIEEAISENDENSVPLLSKGLTPFHSLLKPSITVRDYLSRITKHAALTPAMLLSMMYYIDRLSSIFPAFLINSFTAHRFLITAATVACKGLSDSFLRTVAYARIGGVKASELRRLVRLFLYYLDWGIVPHPETLVAYYRGLVTRSDGYIFEP
ncbi:cyclin-domain-containing protein, partial [Fusarium redolens]